jgi:hypothetical protein
VHPWRETSFQGYAFRGAGGDDDDGRMAVLTMLTMMLGRICNLGRLTDQFRPPRNQAMDTLKGFFVKPTPQEQVRSLPHKGLSV